MKLMQVNETLSVSGQLSEQDLEALQWSTERDGAGPGAV